MSYQTILVYLNKSARTAEHIKIAANIALATHAHLVGTSMIGVSTDSFEKIGDNSRDTEIQNHVQFLRDRATQLVAEFNLTAQKIGVDFYEGRVVDGDVNQGILLQARYSDLLVIGQSNRSEPSREVAPDFPEYVVMNSGRPVLIIPCSGQFDSVGKKVLISWDGSREATRAVNDAIPLLQLADIVQVAIFNADTQLFGDQPGDDIALFLARHGIKLEVLQNTNVENVGKALLSLAANLSSDLLVMGGYGHSRFREKLLGGVTRTILDTMSIPVLMSH